MQAIARVNRVFGEEPGSGSRGDARFTGDRELIKAFRDVKWRRPARRCGRVRAILRKVAESEGITAAVSPHWLRRAHASHALDHGAPLHLVRETLGHASVATTSIYLHVRPGDSSARFLVIGKPADPAVSQEPKTRRTATVAQQARRVAPGEGKAGNKATSGQERAQRR